jgi:hypothetical protein
MRHYILFLLTISSFSIFGQYAISPSVFVQRNDYLSFGFGTTTPFSFTAPGTYDWGARPRMIKRASTGVIVAVWKESTQHELGDGYFNINFSNDDGATWTANNTKIGGGAVTGFPYVKTAPSADQCDDVLLLECANGDLLLISHERLDTAPPNDWITNWQHRSTDGGETWTAEANLASLLPDVADAKKFWAFYDYEIIGTDLYICAAQYDTDFDDSKVTLWKSTDDGATYTKVSDIFAYDDTTPDPNETGILHLGSGEMMVVTRTRDLNKTLIRRSTDYGATWGTIQDASDLFGGIGIHQPCLRKVGERIFLFGRWYSTSTYWKNGMWYSDDEGITWSQVVLDNIGNSDMGYFMAVLKDDGVSWVGLGYFGTLTAATIYQYEIQPND